MQDHYQLGKQFGKIMFILEESSGSYRESGSGVYKTNYKQIMEALVEALLIIEDNNISDPTVQDMTDEIERLVEIYGELKFDKNLPKGQRIIGGLRQKITISMQKRKNLKKDDVEILWDKVKIWDDRVNIALSTN